MKVRSGPARVIDGGMVATFHGHDLELALPLGEQSVGVHWAFREDEGGPRVVSTASGSVFRLECWNLDGRGSAEPVLLGEAGDQLLFLNFQLLRFGTSVDRFVAWTAYAVPKADVGWSAG